MTNFKVGQKVRCVSEECGCSSIKIGDINTVTSLSASGAFVRFNNEKTGWSSNHFELMDEKTDQELADEVRANVAKTVELRKQLEERGYKFTGVHPNISFVKTQEVRI